LCKRVIRCQTVRPMPVFGTLLNAAQTAIIEDQSKWKMSRKAMRYEQSNDTAPSRF